MHSTKPLRITSYNVCYTKLLRGIQVYDGNGIKLDDKHVVMYRAYANGAWLPWVSNANPTKMQEIKDREKFDGDLDVTSGHAGSIGIPP